MPNTSYRLYKVLGIFGFLGQKVETFHRYFPIFGPKAIERTALDYTHVILSCGTPYINRNTDERKNENWLRKYFLDFGAISELEVQADKGQAFITFDDHDSVDRAVSKKHTVSLMRYPL